MARKSRFENENYNSPVATRIREQLERNNISRMSLAEQAGVSGPAISQFLSGQSTPKLETLVKIADAFGTTTDYLLGRTDDPNPQHSIIDDTGLTAEAVSVLKSFKHSQMQGYDLLYIINRILCSPNLVHALANTDMYLAALQAKEIRSSLFHTIVESEEEMYDLSAEVTDESIDRFFERSDLYSKEIQNIVDTCVYGRSVTNALVQLAENDNPYRKKLESIYAVDALSAYGKILNELVNTCLSSVKVDKNHQP